MPWLDGRSLTEILREIELASASWEGSSGIAGSYLGLWSDLVLPPSRHFLGEPAPGYARDDGRIPMLRCRHCGFPQCWSWVARIEVGGAIVRWRDFGNPHRPKWKYSALGDIVFDRRQYELALTAARA